MAAPRKHRRVRPSLEPVRRLLERDLIEWADDDSLRLVWADLMLQEGDRLGELILLDHVAETCPASLQPPLRERAEALRAQLDKRLWSNRAHQQRGLELRWHAGFVRELDLVVEEMPGRQLRDKARHIEGLLPLVLREQALRFVEAIRIIVADEQPAAWLGWMCRSRSHLPTLRELHVGAPAQLRERPAGAWESGRTRPRFTWGDTAHRDTPPRLSSFQRLRWFSIDGELIRVPCCEGGSPTKQHFVRNLAKRPLTSPNRVALCRALWDASTTVQGAAFATIASLGPRADFALEDLRWMLRPPLSKRDPRPAQALQAMAAIGPAGAELLPEILADLERSELLQSTARALALLDWFATLGPQAIAALPIVDAVLARGAGEIPSELRQAGKRARGRISG